MTAAMPACGVNLPDHIRDRFTQWIRGSFVTHTSDFDAAQTDRNRLARNVRDGLKEIRSKRANPVDFRRCKRYSKRVDMCFEVVAGFFQWHDRLAVPLQPLNRLSRIAHDAQAGRDCLM